jgi:ribulose-5-phosphate 4-epimerase/fuculose-1-phosphate aldolase
VSETGAVKFTAERAASIIAPFVALTELNNYRSKLRQQGLLGVDVNGISFGNISVRDGLSPQFFITASGSSGKDELRLNDFARVTAWDFARNWLRFEGASMASSESLTHAALYQADDNMGAVIHGHSLKIWTALLDQAPSAPAEIEYGTPAMALAVHDLLETTNLRETKAFAMAGHRAGVVAFGKNLSEAYAALLGAMPPEASS